MLFRYCKDSGATVIIGTTGLPPDDITDYGVSAVPNVAGYEFVFLGAWYGQAPQLASF